MVSLSIVPWLKDLLRFTQLMKRLLSFECMTSFPVFANTRKNCVFVAILVIRAKKHFFVANLQIFATLPKKMN